MEQFLKRTWLQINLNAIGDNFAQIRAVTAPDAKIMAVVKADAYGHGVEYTIREMNDAGADWFALSNLEEAMQVRRAGTDKPLLILGYTPPEYARQLALNQISQAVFDVSYGRRLSKEAQKAGVQVNIHVKADTGMSRIGFPYLDNVTDADSVDAAAEICRLPGLYPEGIFTHFASADEGADGALYTRLQFDLFCDLISRLRARGITFELCHCSNSAATTGYPEMHLDMVRPGIILYGLLPSEEAALLALQPAMELKTVVSMKKTIAAGTPVSYGRTFTAAHDMTVATVPVGYADGYPRALSNRAYMLIGGHRVPVVGRVCMDQCMLDVTGLDFVEEGMTVTVFGRDGEEEITVNEVARWAGVINYEILCGISKRVPRIYIRDGKILGTVDYIAQSPRM